MQEVIEKYCTTINTARLAEIYSRCEALLNKYEGWMSNGESKFLRTWIRTRKIPTLALTVKDHKPPNADGNYPMRTIVSAHNFTQGFAKLASQGLQAIFELNSIQYGKRTQSSTVMT